MSVTQNSHNWVECLDAGDNYLDQNGGIPPTRDQWRELTRNDLDLPSVSVITDLFGTWSDFIEELGVEPYV